MMVNPESCVFKNEDGVLVADEYLTSNLKRIELEDMDRTEPQIILPTQKLIYWWINSKKNFILNTNIFWIIFIRVYAEKPAIEAFVTDILRPISEVV